MILRRYGTTFQSVDVEFAAKALNEFGFRRNKKLSFPAEELESRYEAIETREMATEADGPVQNEVEQELLDRLHERVKAAVAELPDGGVLVVENESGHDYPKTRQVTKNVVVQGENRLHFAYTMAPPLRVTLYRPRS